MPNTGGKTIKDLHTELTKNVDPADRVAKASKVTDLSATATPATVACGTPG